jgi:cell division protein FtsQ
MRGDADCDTPEPSLYLRRSKPVDVRRGSVRWKRTLLAGGSVVLFAGGALVGAAYGVHSYLKTSPRFTLRETILIGGENIPREQIARIFAADAGRSVFEIPLRRRRAEILALPWVQSAHVIRGWPDRIRVLIRERQPVAFVRLPAGLGLIDREGVLLNVPAGRKFPFPVLDGISPLQTPAERKKRVELVMSVLADLDREKPPRSPEVSEIDVSDPDNAAVTVTQAGSAVLVHLGNAHFLERYQLFLENVESWREQYGSVRSVDLRYEKQVIVKP